MISRKRHEKLRMMISREWLQGHSVKIFLATVLGVAIALGASSCRHLDTDPSHRTSAIVVVEGATDIRYWSEGGKREGANYLMHSSPPADEALAEIHRRLAEAGWIEGPSPSGGTWDDVTRRRRDSTSEALRCWQKFWNRQGEELSYVLCTESSKRVC